MVSFTPSQCSPEPRRNYTCCGHVIERVNILAYAVQFEQTHLSGNVKLVHHFQFIVHPDATFHQVQFTVLKVTEVKLKDLRFLRARQDLRLEMEIIQNHTSCCV